MKELRAAIAMAAIGVYCFGPIEARAQTAMNDKAVAFFAQNDAAWHAFLAAIAKRDEKKALEIGKEAGLKRPEVGKIYRSSADLASTAADVSVAYW